MKKRLETPQKPQEAYSRNYYYASRQGNLNSTEPNQAPWSKVGQCLLKLCFEIFKPFDSSILLFRLVGSRFHRLKFEAIMPNST